MVEMGARIATKFATKFVGPDLSPAFSHLKCSGLTASLVRHATGMSFRARLDSDIVHWLRKESERRGIPYQTLTNSVLKEAMTGSLTTVDAIRKVIREELERKAS